MEGWIKISRHLPEHWLWADAERLKWWLDLLLLAAWEDREVMHDAHTFTLLRGQMIMSAGDLAMRWKKSRPTVIKFLSLLESEKMISRQTLYRQTSIITICKYESYQSGFDTQVDTILYTQVDTLTKEKENPLPNTLLSKKKKTPTNVGEKEKKEYKPTKVGMSSFDDADISYDRLAKFFNEKMIIHHAMIKPIRDIKNQRRTMVTARIKERGKKAFVEMIEKAAVSHFLNGANNRGFVASFDWLIRPNNFIKVLEGNYDNRESGSTIVERNRATEAAGIVARLLEEDANVG